MTEYRYPEVDEVLFRRVLSNGLTVSVIPRRGFARTVAYLVADFGSVHTSFRLDGQQYTVPAGIAHYLEHKMFDMPCGRDMTEEFALLGASVNAFTSYDMTAYYFTCTEHFSRCLELLLEMVSTPCFPAESVERERGIIDQEIRMNLDSPDSVIFDRLMEAAYRSHPVRIPILGTSESIRRITPEELTLCHRGFYAPGNLLLCVIGDVDPEEVFRIAEGCSPSRPTAEKCREWEEEMTVPQPVTELEMEVAMPTFSLVFKCEPPGRGAEAIRMEMVADLASEVLFGESSELYLQLYEQGLIDSSFGGGFDVLDGCAMLTVSGDSRDPETVRDALLRQARELVRTGIGEETFRRLKRSALGRRIRELDSFDGTCFRVCAYHFAEFDYFRFPEIYRQIAPRELTDFLDRVVRPERCAICILRPTAEGKEPI